MPSYNVSVPHPLSQADAVERLQSVLAKAQDFYGDQVGDLQQQWTDNVLKYAFRVLGMQIGGTMTVLDKRVDVVGDLPLAAALLKGRITSTLEEQLRRVLK